MTKGTIVFNCITVDGKNVIDVSQVEDPEVERLRIVVEDGRVYVFVLVTKDGYQYLVLDQNNSDTEGIEHALAVYENLRGSTSPASNMYLRVWDDKRRYHTPQPQRDGWLMLHVGILSPAKKWGTEAIRHAMLGGHITEIGSAVLELQS